jgi:hypothetical protein
MKALAIDLVLWTLASPVYVALALRRLLRNYRFLRVAARAAIRCECGAAVSLVGMWRCTCGFTYRGHLLTVCPVCASLPCVVRCYRCGVTTKLPEPA